MNYYSPLRYPGGKGKISNYFKQVYKENSLYDGCYVEPYAGGASVALSLLINEYVSNIIINDIDKSIYSFWYCVLNRTDELCKLIKDTPVTVNEWNKQKYIQKNKKRYGNLKVGFATFFLNRTNRSGILNAGIIGGKEQKGNWKIDARYNKVDLINRIKRIAKYKDSIQLFNKDAVGLIKILRKTLPQNTLFYFDPPYFIKGKDLYLNYYTSEDHKSIAKEIKKIQSQKWIVTYDNVDFISNQYEEFRKEVYTLNYSAAKAGKGKELMVFSDNISIPDIKLIDKKNQ
jgi:DNA adenine methylase